MKIGVRALPTEVVYCILDPEKSCIVNVDKIVVPKSLDTPEQLKHIRLNLLDILREYEIKYAGIRVLEPTAQSVSVERVQIEGVILEAFASSKVEGYYVGQVSSISSRININRVDFKKYVDNELDFESVEGWGSFNKNQREAILCALGA
ncbi:hypothetical protein [Alcaligenes faecalis]|uniref:Uncharacterized protein n=1 Tax=Alcaligenes faecalis TaxID=511 RepID=A0AAE9H7J4_ALCFA|nr:hypothetical protein [Alcaligenes faecalis]UPL21865.1 hypothetical protein MXF72_01935 [Alcaligenes faecalis]